eukprot:2344673-Amphidinium_carterae.1
MQLDGHCIFCEHAHQNHVLCLMLASGSCQCVRVASRTVPYPACAQKRYWGGSGHQAQTSKKVPMSVYTSSIGTHKFTLQTLVARPRGPDKWQPCFELLFSLQKVVAH